MPTAAIASVESKIDLMPVEAIREQFPALRRVHEGKPVAYFDGPGGTQIPGRVVEAIKDYLLNHNANTHWNYPASAETDAALQSSREAIADLFNCSPREIAFGNNMTTLTFHIARALGRKWGPGDEVVVTELDHQANVAPWRALAQERGLTIRCVPFDVQTGELDWDEFERCVTEKTRLVAVGAASNALGTISDVRRAARLTQERGALCFVDGVHFAAHRLIDVCAMECDFLVCSPYKFYGPHTGAIYVRAEVMATMDVPKLEPASNDIPERVETGTQNHEGIVGAGAAVEFLASLAEGGSRRGRLVAALNGLHDRGDAQVKKLWDGLEAIDGVKLYGPPPGNPRTPTLSFVVSGIPSSQVAKELTKRGIFASNGNFYATTVLERLGHRKEGMVRAGCACYTTDEEIDRLIEGISEISRAARTQA